MEVTEPFPEFVISFYLVGSGVELRFSCLTQCVYTQNYFTGKCRLLDSNYMTMLQSGKFGTMELNIK